MTALFPSTDTRVSRNSVALDRFVWQATAGMFWFASLSVGYRLSRHPKLEVALLELLLVTMGCLLQFAPPPRIGTIANHAVLVATYVAVALGVVVFQPGGSAAWGAAMFIGPLCATRLFDRRQIMGHLLAATLLLLIPAGLGVVDHLTVVALITIVPAMWLLAACCAVILEVNEAQGKQLEGLVRQDPLTALGNRRLLEERLSYELGRRRTRGNHPLSVIVLDLNGFKALNDRVGHAAGDELLIKVAGILKASTRSGDTLVRQGGDEFCILLPETGPDAAATVGRAVRSALAELRVEGEPLTTGLGIASYPEDVSETHDLVEIADERLLVDKDRSRRRPDAD